MDYAAVTHPDNGLQRYQLLTDGAVSVAYDGPHVPLVRPLVDLKQTLLCSLDRHLPCRTKLLHLQKARKQIDEILQFNKKTPHPLPLLLLLYSFDGLLF